MRAILVSTASMLSVEELGIVEASVRPEVNGGGDWTAKIALPSTAVTEWQHSVGFLTDDYAPLAFGPVTKSRADIGAGVVELSGMTWEGYLGHVWLTDTYDADGTADAATAIRNRLVSLKAWLATQTPSLTVPIPTNSVAASGATIDYSFKAPIDDSEPPSVADDLRTITDQGVRFAFRPSLSGGTWTLTLAVDVPPLTAAATLTVGVDIPKASVGSDGTAQVNWWHTRGADGLLSVGKHLTSTAPVLMRSRTFDSVATQAALDASAAAMVAATSAPVVSMSDVAVTGLLDVRCGDLVTVDVPAATVAEYPNGAGFDLRVSGIDFANRQGEGDITTLTLTQPLDDMAIWAAPPPRLSNLLRRMATTVRRLNSRP